MRQLASILAFTLPIPNARLLRGTHFTAQWFALDATANPLGLAASDGGEGIIW